MLMFHRKTLSLEGRPQQIAFSFAFEDSAWAAVQRAPGATLVLLDALEQLRLHPRLPGPAAATGAGAFPEAPLIQRQSSGSICGGKPAVEMEVHGAMAGVLFL